MNIITCKATIGKPFGPLNKRRAFVNLDGHEIGYFISNDNLSLPVGSVVEVTFHPDDQFCKIVVPKTSKLQIVIDLEVDRQGEMIQTIISRINQTLKQAMDNGTFTGETAATVEHYKFSVEPIQQ